MKFSLFARTQARLTTARKHAIPFSHLRKALDHTQDECATVAVGEYIQACHSNAKVVR